MKTFLRSCALSGLALFLLAGCASTVEPSDAYKGESQHEIYEKGKAALDDKSFGEAIKRFEALDVQYPYGQDTENAQLYIIYAYYMKEEYALGRAAADRFIRIHPTHANVDYAFYMRGLCDYYQNLGFLERFFNVDLATRDLTQLNKAFYDFQALATQFPNSVYTPAAHQYMIYIRNILADHQLEVAQFYFDHKAYLASANRAADIAAHYEGAPAVVGALKLMVQSYHKLGIKQQEQEAMFVLKYNYPNATVDLS